uniref:Uncharacterized protein n=1 Tax=Romanomermis culicivorax TaxID=13658 RepID=A0A915HUC6_ROMCU
MKTHLSIDEINRPLTFKLNTKKFSLHRRRRRLFADHTTIEHHDAAVLRGAENPLWLKRAVFWRPETAKRSIGWQNAITRLSPSRQISNRRTKVALHFLPSVGRPTIGFGFVVVVGRRGNGR